MRWGFYFQLYLTALKARTEYRVDFLVGVLTALSMQLASFAFFWVIFERAPTLGGWSPAEVLFLFGLTALVLGLAEATFNGIWWLPWYILDGQIDRVLVYPVNSLGFVLLTRPELHSLGNMSAGAVTLGVAWSLAPPPLWTLALVPVWVICGAAVYTAVLVLMGALTFKLVGPWSTHMLAMHHLLNAARYPASIYPRWLSALILFVLPFGAAIYWPANFLRGQGSLWLALLAPPVAAIASMSVAWVSWNLSIRSYQSTGS
jgi:ABC-2 type transport system permease protein